MEKIDQNLIIYICNHGFSYDAMKEARRAGARGGTILHGRSSISQEKTKFFGIRLHPEKDVLLIVAKKENTDVIMKALTDSFGVETEARGLCFSLAVSESIGFSFNPLPPFEK